MKSVTSLAPLQCFFLRTYSCFLRSFGSRPSYQLCCRRSALKLNCCGSSLGCDGTVYEDGCDELFHEEIDQMS